VLDRLNVKSQKIGTEIVINSVNDGRCVTRISSDDPKDRESMMKIESPNDSVDSIKDEQNKESDRLTRSESESVKESTK
jgi:hypothetical protein